MNIEEELDEENNSTNVSNQANLNNLNHIDAYYIDQAEEEETNSTGEGADCLYNNGINPELIISDETPQPNHIITHKENEPSRKYKKPHIYINHSDYYSNKSNSKQHSMILDNEFDDDDYSHLTIDERKSDLEQQHAMDAKQLVCVVIGIDEQQGNNHMLSISSTSTGSTSSSAELATSATTTLTTATTNSAAFPQNISPLNPNRFVYIQFPLKASSHVAPPRNNNKRDFFDCEKENNTTAARQKSFSQAPTFFDKKQFEINSSKLSQRQSLQQQQSESPIRLNQSSKMLNRFHSFRLDDKLSHMNYLLNNGKNLAENSNLSKSYLDLTKAHQEENEEEEEDLAVDLHDKSLIYIDSDELKIEDSLNEAVANNAALSLDPNLDRKSYLKLELLNLERSSPKRSAQDFKSTDTNKIDIYTEVLGDSSNLTKKNADTADDEAYSKSSSPSSSAPPSPCLPLKKPTHLSQMPTPKSTRHAANIVLSSLKRSIKRSSVNTKKSTSAVAAMAKTSNYHSDSENLTVPHNTEAAAAGESSPLYNLPKIKLLEPSSINNEKITSLVVDLNNNTNSNNTSNESNNESVAKRERHDSGVGGSITRDIR
jgi:hypothetical protein